ncbi:P63C domain-containing protein [Lewinella sp. IMCC34191]|uniref:P63C domain-containing protein n=1 Tax=Lewinella sp. IMCC34191 TaxID=2259172 RepID=UPI000E26D50C|nr:P63C domain-containing protein [Lewinella sp. IMCC34191]
MSNTPLIKATHQGELEVNDLTITCAVLEDGTRVVSERSIADSIGAVASGSYWRKRKEGGASKPRYLYARYLDPYISKDLREKVSLSIDYLSVSQVESTGLPAELLPEICDVWVKAHQKGAIPESRRETAENAYKLLKGFATVGIIALVDEATGYQHEREQDELQRILKAYISPELLPWQKRFPDIFYKELFRLNGWDYTVKGIKKRPGVVGRWTTTLVYDQLPDGVVEELKSMVPKSEAGNYTVRWHQGLTENIGSPHLAAQINQIITLFQLSDNMKHMWQQFAKLKSRQAGQLEIPFSFDDKGRTVEPIDKEQLTDFDKGLVKALQYNPKDN